MTKIAKYLRTMPAKDVKEFKEFERVLGNATTKELLIIVIWNLEKLLNKRK